MRLIALLGAVWLAYAQAQDEEKDHPGRYLIIAPKRIRPNSPYTFSLQLLRGIPAQNTFTAEIRDDKNATLMRTSLKNIPMAIPQTVEIPSAKKSLVDGKEYSLYVKGAGRGGRALFEEQQGLEFSGKALSMFVQTDKAVYKPGDKVQYRVVALRPNLRPYRNRINVRISDPKGNVIVNKENVRLQKGVTMGQIQLSEEPPLGAWNIEVKTRGGNNEMSKNFDVDKYVLPKFEVNIEPPDIMVYTDDLKVTVSSKYTYGKPVEGPVAVEVKPPWAWYDDGEEGSKKIRVTGTLKDGEFTATFKNRDLKSRELVSKWGSGSIEINAAVTENLTGIKRETSKQVQFYPNKYELSMQKSTENFKPGLPFNIFVTAKTRDDKPIGRRDSKKVKMTVRYTIRLPTPPTTTTPKPNPLLGEDVVVLRRGPWGGRVEEPTKEQTENKILTLGADGTKSLSLKVPKDTKSINVEGWYNGKDNIGNLKTDNIWQNDELRKTVTQASVWSEATLSPTESFLLITPDSTADAKAGETKSFSVTSTGNVQRLSYQVVSRGLVILSETTPARRGATKISIQATPEMAPKARLVVFAVRTDNKEIIVDALDFNVDGLFENEVAVRVRPKEAEPGDTVRVEVKADRGSDIHLLGVDQSVLLLKSGNDITPDMVENDVEQYGSSGWWGGCPWCRGRRKRSIWFPWGISGKDAKSIFDNAGLLVFTDAFLYEEPVPDYQELRFSGLVADDPSAGRPALRRVASPSQSLAKKAKGVGPTKTRSEFPETWLWAQFNASNTTG